VKYVLKRIAWFAPLLAACGGGHAITTPIPNDPNVAVNQFLAAVKDKDINGMGQVWGDEDNLEVNLVKPAEFRMRVIPLQIYLSNKGYRIMAGPVPVQGVASRRTYRVELQRTNCTFPVTLTVVQMHRGGWLFYGTDLSDVVNASKNCRAEAADEVKP
jgi:hypothetical protein